MTPETLDLFSVAFAYLLSIGCGVAILIALASIRLAVASSSWSLADALSEPADLTARGGDGLPLLATGGQPMTVTEMRASSSRLIALIGLIGIFVVFVGFGLAILKDFALSRTLPTQDQLGAISSFLFAGVTMFAPYLVNKFASVFDWLKPGK